MGDPRNDRRCQVLVDWISSRAMVVLNQGEEPTFVRGASFSYIDVTCASERLAGKIRSWEVMS